MASNFFPASPFKDEPIDVLLKHKPTDHDNEINALSTVTKHRDITTKNGCTATLYFCEHENPHIRQEVAELLLRSVEKRSEAT